MLNRRRRKRGSVTFSVFDENAYTGRQFSVSHNTLFVAGFIALACFVLVVFVSFNCIALHNAKTRSMLLAKKISRQQQKIATQDRQLKLLSSKLAELGKYLSNLRELEGDIHKIARIDKAAIHDNMFGVGGSRSEAEAEAEAVSKKSQAEETPDAGTDIKGIGKGSTSPVALFHVTEKRQLALAVGHHDFIVNPITCMPFALPVEGTVIENFGNEETAAFGEQTRMGIAIKTSPGSKIVAPSNGIVTYTGKVKPGRDTLIIEHGFGFITRYTNLESVSVHEGDIIKKNEIIGSAGTDPLDPSEGFIYYEVLFNGIQINPHQCASTRPFASRPI